MLHVSTPKGLRQTWMNKMEGSQIAWIVILWKDLFVTKFSVTVLLGLLYKNQFYCKLSSLSCCRLYKFYGKFAKLRNVIISLVISIRMERLGFHRTVFRVIWFLNIFRKSVEKIQLSLKSDKNNWYYTWRPMYIYDHFSLNSSQNVNCFRGL
jgi:hypothetical protein